MVADASVRTWATISSANACASGSTPARATGYRHTRETSCRTRFGLDYVLLSQPDGSTVETPVQRGDPRPTPAMPNGLEILSGVHAGDVLVKP